MRLLTKTLACALACFLPVCLWAQSVEPAAQQSYEECILASSVAAADALTLAEIRASCATYQNDMAIAEQVIETATDEPAGAISERDFQQMAARNSPYLLAAHRPNYMLPFSYTTGPNDKPYQAVNLQEGALNNTEFQFQLSIKFPLVEQMIFEDSTLWMGYSIRAFWHAYKGAYSSPFRETNHEPEFIWSIPSTIEMLGFRNTSNDLILNHQSNGQSGTLSRSWNRAMVATHWERGNLALALKPWACIAERYGPDPDQDDNPDIEDYLGNFEFLATYVVQRQSLSLLWRNNLDRRNRGAAEITYSYPISPRVDASIKYFNGYDESLIDYNHSTQRFAFGIQITDWF